MIFEVDPDLPEDSIEQKHVKYDGWNYHICGNAIPPNEAFCHLCKQKNLNSTIKECPKCGSDYDSIDQIATLNAKIVALKIQIVVLQTPLP